MNGETELLARKREKEKQLPPAVPVQVHCAGVRCLAYRDKDGHWRSYYNRERLPGRVEIVPPQW